MAEEKKEGSVTFLNRGLRHYDLGFKDGKPCRHAPGTTMVYTAEEARRAAGYRDLVDITKLPGQVDTGKIKAENAKLQDENSRLRAQLEALTPKTEDASSEQEPEKKKSKKQKEQEELVA